MPDFIIVGPLEVPYRFLITQRISYCMQQKQSSNALIFRLHLLRTLCLYLLEETVHLDIWSDSNLPPHNRGQSWRKGTKCDCKIDWLWVRLLLEEVKYSFTFIFSFLRSGVEAKRGAEFHHSAYLAVCVIQRKAG